MSCSTCQKKAKLEQKRAFRKAKATAPWLHSLKHGAKAERSKLLEPISDDRQRQIDEEIDLAAEKRFYLNPLDPRAAQIIRPAIWLWQ